MVLLLDNFDSFTFNLLDYFGQLGVQCQVIRNDKCEEDIFSGDYSGIVLSPGPERPETAGNLMNVLDFYAGSLPILGICLGHQAIGLHYGAKLIKAEKPMHGKVSTIHCNDQQMFDNIPIQTQVVRYHSLVLEKLPPSLKVTAKTDKGEIMALKHNSLPIWGYQFHPEAILTTFGKKMLGNWIESFDIR